MAADIWTFPPTADSLRFLTGYEVKALNGRVGRIDDNSLAPIPRLRGGYGCGIRTQASHSSVLTIDQRPGGKIYLTYQRELREAPVYKPIEPSIES